MHRNAEERRFSPTYHLFDRRPDYVADDLDAAVPAHLVAAFRKSLAAIPALAALYGNPPPTLRWRDWARLPVTDRAFYSRLHGAKDAVREPETLFSCAPPLNLSNPLLPFASYQSRHDRDFARERLAAILSGVPIGRGDQSILVSGNDQFYFAAEVAELAVKSGFPFTVLLAGNRAPSEIADRLESLGARLVFWALGRAPDPAAVPQDAALLTVNCPSYASPHRWHADIGHADPLPYFGLRLGEGFYSNLLGHSHVERCDERYVITTLGDELLPLVRFDTEISTAPLLVESYDR